MECRIHIPQSLPINKSLTIFFSKQWLHFALLSPSCIFQMGNPGIPSQHDHTCSAAAGWGLCTVRPSNTSVVSSCPSNLEATWCWVRPCVPCSSLTVEAAAVGGSLQGCRSPAVPCSTAHCFMHGHDCCLHQQHGAGSTAHTALCHHALPGATPPRSAPSLVGPRGSVGRALCLV